MISWKAARLNTNITAILSFFPSFVLPAFLPRYLLCYLWKCLNYINETDFGKISTRQPCQLYYLSETEVCFYITYMIKHINYIFLKKKKSAKCLELLELCRKSHNTCRKLSNFIPGQDKLKLRIHQRIQKDSKSLGHLKRKTHTKSSPSSGKFRIYSISMLQF